MKKSFVNYFLAFALTVVFAVGNVTAVLASECTSTSCECVAELRGPIIDTEDMD